MATDVRAGCWIDGTISGHNMPRDVIRLAQEFGFVTDGLVNYALEAYEEHSFDKDFPLTELIDLSHQAVDWLNHRGGFDNQPEPPSVPEGYRWNFDSGSFGVYLFDEEAIRSAAVDILRESIKLLEDPAHWTQEGVFAIDASGEEVEPWDPTACQWCMEGAPYKIAGDWLPEAALAVRMIKKAVPNTGEPYDYNDQPGRKHSDIIAALRRTVAIAEQQ